MLHVSCCTFVLLLLVQDPSQEKPQEASAYLSMKLPGARNRPALDGGMDWWRCMEWPFAQSPNNVPQRLKFSRKSQEFQRGEREREREMERERERERERKKRERERDFHQFQAPNFEASEPEKIRIHPSPQPCSSFN